MTNQQSAADEPAHAPTHVVTCFLLRRDRGHDETLLARRSERVRTYRGAWAAISGYVEPDMEPIDQAYQEIREETGLDRSGVALLRAGEPIAFHDADIGQDWVVHPFLFLALRPDAVRHDWEANKFAWMAPDAVRSLATVPRLAEALAHVYPPETE
ncbi:MAG TPA: NUDIX domain-containing protein [Ktedonobacterales bacterium]|jgi:8-oxo-dGTP pyrophosphatase MutT (NUDIX family)|nr:NUDIX domain-containing protein [Ktedonobacterales bacterium]